MAEALERVRTKIEELKGQGKKFRRTGRDTVRSSRQKPGERLMEREGPIRRFLNDRDRPLLGQLKEGGPLRDLLKKDT